jgi:hypothetical protein
MTAFIPKCARGLKPLSHSSSPLNEDYKSVFESPEDDLGYQLWDLSPWLFGGEWDAELLIEALNTNPECWEIQ